MEDKMNEQTIEKHSVNCFICGRPKDERDCVSGKDNEGSVCSQCQEFECCESPNFPEGGHIVDFQQPSLPVVTEYEDWDIKVTCKHCGRPGIMKLYEIPHLNHSNYFVKVEWKDR